MAADLDRAYVINGDDLHRALGEIQPKTLVPRDVAKYILGRIAKPLDGTLIRTGQLAAWFREHEFATSGHTGDSFGKATHPDALAETILEHITGQAHPVPGDARDELANVLSGHRVIVRDPGPAYANGYHAATLHEHYADALAEELISDIKAVRDGEEPPGERGQLPRVHHGNAVNDAVERCRAALSWLSPENRQRAVSTLVGDVIKDGKPAVLPVRAEPDAEIAAMDAICHTLAHLGDADAVRRIIRYLRARFAREA